MWGKSVEVRLRAGARINWQHAKWSTKGRDESNLISTRKTRVSAPRSNTVRRQQNVKLLLRHVSRLILEKCGTRASRADQRICPTGFYSDILLSTRLLGG